MIVRGILGIANSAAILFFEQAVRQAYGITAGYWYLVLQASQFHVMYYASRTLPNMFAFAMSMSPRPLCTAQANIGVSNTCNAFLPAIGVWQPPKTGCAQSSSNSIHYRSWCDLSLRTRDSPCGHLRQLVPHPKKVDQGRNCTDRISCGAGSSMHDCSC